MIADIIIVLIIAGLVVLSIRTIRGRKGSCGSCSGCAGGCGNCSGQIDRNSLAEVRRKMERLSSEAIAVCCDGTKCVCFEQTEYFLIGFAKEGKLQEIMITSSGLRGTKERLKMLKMIRVKHVVCKGIGEESLHRLEEAGIDCFETAEEQRETALQNYLAFSSHSAL